MKFKNYIYGAAAFAHLYTCYWIYLDPARKCYDVPLDAFLVRVIVPSVFGTRLFELSTEPDNILRAYDLMASHRSA
jgi:hypothetical protein